jgi:glycosyltransferase involved in cell wall biosynthesis
MRLSIVVPAYNEEALLGRCLQAIEQEVARSRRDVEVVVVDNASTDGTVAIAASFERVRVVEEPRKGIVHARQRGFDSTRGEIVANIDADTIMPPGWIDTVFSEFEKDPRLVCLSGPEHFIDLPAWQQVIVDSVYWAAIPLYIVVHDWLKVASFVQGGNFVFSRMAWLAAGGYDVSIAFYGEDTDVARRLQESGNVKWTFALRMPASGRRFAEEGIVRSGLRYLANYLSMSLRGRPFSQRYTDVRPPGTFRVEPGPGTPADPA